MTPRERLVILLLLRSQRNQYFQLIISDFHGNPRGNGAGTSHGFPGPAGTGRADDAPPQGLSFLMAKNRRMRAVLAEQLLFFISREEEYSSACGIHALRKVRDFRGQGPYPVFSAWRQFAGNVFETQYRKAFSLPENAGQIRQRAFRPYGTRQLPHSGLSGRIGNPFAAHRPGGPPHTYYPPF